jgi:hypothetical protein
MSSDASLTWTYTRIETKFARRSTLDAAVSRIICIEPTRTNRDAIIVLKIGRSWVRKTWSAISVSNWACQTGRRTSLTYAIYSKGSSSYTSKIASCSINYVSIIADRANYQRTVSLAVGTVLGTTVTSIIHRIRKSYLSRTSERTLLVIIEITIYAWRTVKVVSARKAKDGGRAGKALRIWTIVSKRALNKASIIEKVRSVAS